MTNQVKIFQGTYRNAPITDTVFPLVKPIQYGKKGMFITVDASKVLDPSKKAIRVLIESEKDVSYVPVEDQVVEKVVEEKEETTEEKVEETTVEENLEKAQEEIDELKEEELKEDCSCGHGSDCNCSSDCGCGCNAVSEAVEEVAVTDEDQNRLKDLINYQN